MHKPAKFVMILRMALVTLLLAAANSSAAELASRTWRKNNPQWRALHLIGPQPRRLDVTKELITTLMVANRFGLVRGQSPSPPNTLPPTPLRAPAASLPRLPPSHALWPASDRMMSTSVVGFLAGHW